MMALGFSLNQVIEMATINAAKLLGRAGKLGTLRLTTGRAFSFKSRRA
jgi:imidazolonepropionase-like amidohydrolase